MSLKSKKRIKQIRPKTSTGFGNAISLGVDGFLTDMVSGLDLEQELRIGGNHYVTITNTAVATEIKEWFFTQPMGNNTLSQMRSSNKISYSVLIYIASAIDYYLVQQEDDENSKILWNGEDDYIVDRVAVPSTNQRIQITLYDKDMEDNNILHKKIITLSETSTQYGDDITINQYLEEQGG